MWLPILMAVITGYLLGNLNGAVSMSVLLSNEDVRTKGSGNAGLTNFIRNFGSANAILVVLIDAGKAVIACITGALLLQPYDCYLEGAVLGGMAVMLGHAYPALLGFRGGKGILSGLFISVVVDWRIALIVLTVFFVVYFMTHYVSLSSVLAAASFSAGFAIFHDDNLFVMLGGILMGTFAIFMHRSNIVRLCKGQERKTDLFAKGKSQ